MEKIEFKEIVELFLNTTIHQIKFESEVPNINFLFKEDGIASTIPSSIYFN